MEMEGIFGTRQIIGNWRLFAEEEGLVGMKGM
jgi:hypothetical protein